jgi:hypothetical protein
MRWPSRSKSHTLPGVGEMQRAFTFQTLSLFCASFFVLSAHAWGQSTNKVALYNFLSTCSGTHFVTPRTYTAEIGFHF